MKSSVNMRFVIQVVIFSKIMFCTALGFSALANANQLDDAQQSISVFKVVSSDANAVGEALKKVPLFGKVVGVDVIGRTITVISQPDKNEIHFLGLSADFSADKAHLSVVDQNTIYTLHLENETFISQPASGDRKSETFYTIEKIFETNSQSKQEAEQAEVNSLKAENRLLENKINELEASIAEKNDLLDEAFVAVNVLKQQISDLEANTTSISNDNPDLTLLEAQLRSARREIKRLKAQLSQN